MLFDAQNGRTDVSPLEYEKTEAQRTIRLVAECRISRAIVIEFELDSYSDAPKGKVAIHVTWELCRKKHTTMCDTATTSS